MNECLTHCADCRNRLTYAEQERFGYRCVECFYKWSMRFRAWLSGSKDSMFNGLRNL